MELPGITGCLSNANFVMIETHAHCNTNTYNAHAHCKYVRTHTVKTKVVISHRRCENCLTFPTFGGKSEAILTPSV